MYASPVSPYRLRGLYKLSFWLELGVILVTESERTAKIQGALAQVALSNQIEMRTH